MDVASADRPLELAPRGDLQVAAVNFSSQETYVVSDPVTGEVFQLTTEEFFVWERLRAPVSLNELRQAFEQQFAPRRVTVGQLQAFLDRLYEQQLVHSTRPGQGAALWERGRERRRRGRWSAWSQLLAVRLAGIPAGPWVDRLYCCLRLVWGWPLLLLMAVCGWYAVAILLAHGPEFVASLRHSDMLFARRGILIWITAIAGVKLLHELAHAVACRHFGGTCRQMGVLLLVGMPTLYCDVSDAWRIRSKWRRMAISAAGMATELAVAAVAVVLWWHTHPGMLHAVCLSLVIVCSVGTLLVNANPLLRYDGYHLLADWTETPNLGLRGRELISAWWRSWLLGEPYRPDPLLAPRKKRGLVLYAIASKAYLVLVLVGVYLVASRWAQPRGLHQAVSLAAGLLVALGVLRPLVALVKMLGRPTVRGRLRGIRVVLSAGVLVAVLAGIGWWPVVRWVEAPLVFVPAVSAPVYAPLAGELVAAAPAGDELPVGALVAQLRDASTELSLVQQSGQVTQQQLKLTQARTLRAAQQEISAQIPQLEAASNDAQQQLEVWQQRTLQLTRSAPIAGRLVPPPRVVVDSPGEDALAAWNGTPLEPRNRGAWIEPGTLLGTLVSGDLSMAYAAVDPADIGAVEPGQQVRIAALQYPFKALRGEVRSVTERAQANDPSQPGGPVRDPSRANPPYHVVEIALEPSAPSLIGGGRGTARIETYRSTLGELALRALSRVFRAR
jgi:putative peptide zinc metalloprotease protein